MRQHEFPEAQNVTGERFCLHCGVRWRPVIEATCLDRPDTTAEPRTRVKAMDDVDGIYSRILELRKYAAQISRAIRERRDDAYEENATRGDTGSPKPAVSRPTERP